MDFGVVMLNYLLGIIIVVFVLFVVWILLDKFLKTKKIRGVIEDLMDSVFS